MLTVRRHPPSPPGPRLTILPFSGSLARSRAIFASARSANRVQAASDAEPQSSAPPPPSAADKSPDPRRDSSARHRFRAPRCTQREPFLCPTWPRPASGGAQEGLRVVDNRPVDLGSIKRARTISGVPFPEKTPRLKLGWMTEGTEHQSMNQVHTFFGRHLASDDCSGHLAEILERTRLRIGFRQLELAKCRLQERLGVRRMRRTLQIQSGEKPNRRSVIPIGQRIDRPLNGPLSKGFAAIAQNEQSFRSTRAHAVFSQGPHHPLVHRRRPTPRSQARTTRIGAPVPRKRR
jgi:hypothetical protein